MAYEMVCLVNAELYPTFIRLARFPQREEGGRDIWLLARTTTSASGGHLFRGRLPFQNTGKRRLEHVKAVTRPHLTLTARVKYSVLTAREQ